MTIHRHNGIFLWWLCIIGFSLHGYSETLIVITESETTSGQPISIRGHFLRTDSLEAVGSMPIPGNHLTGISQSKLEADEVLLNTEFYRETQSEDVQTWNYPVSLTTEPLRVDSGYPFLVAPEPHWAGIENTGELSTLSGISSRFKSIGDEKDSICVSVVSGFQGLGDEPRQASLVTVLNSETHAPVSEPFELKGRIEGEIGRIVEVDSSTWLVLSLDDGNGFGYVYRLQKKNGGWRIHEELTLSGIRFSFVVAAGAKPDEFFLGIDNKLSAYRAGVYEPNIAEFASPVRSLLCDGDAVVVGESGQVHRFGLESESIELSQRLNTGIVVAIMPSVSEVSEIPMLTVQPNYLNLDTNETGLAFRNAGVREYDWTWSFESGDEEGISFRHEKKGDHHEWLNISPTETLSRETDQPLILDLHYSMLSGEKDREFFTHRIPLFPERNSIVRNPVVLWVVQDAVYAQARDLIRKSSATPYGYRHMRASVESQTSLEPDLLILDTLSITRGDITRGMVSEYLNRNGHILLLLQPLEKQFVPFMTSWFSRWNISSSFQLEDVTARDWPFRTRSGVPFSAAHGIDQRLFYQDAPSQWGYGEFRTGNGSLSVYSSPSLFFESHDGSFASASSALFGKRPYLVGKVRDRDQDGILDWIESKDEKSDGFSAMYLFDRDEDGVPDGNEDRNRNGIWDFGETHPDRRDTDDDGFWDGADTMPVASLDAPVIESVRPKNGPAEGGYLLTISGNNFTPRSTVWVNKRQATVIDKKLPTVLLVAAPPILSPRTNVSIELKDESTQTFVTMENGFSYDERSEYSFAFDHFRQIAQQYRQYSGKFEIGVPDLNKQVDGIILSLKVKSTSPMDLGFVPDARNDEFRGEWVAERGGGVFTISNSPNVRVHTRKIGTVYWTADMREVEGDEIQIEFFPSRGHVRHGGYFRFRDQTLTLNMNSNLNMLAGR